ncbi:hypothetical protein A2W67_00335 [Candidatus Nomurabacteria bacterium RIFCSPLOWO2_02_40_28]|uniref:Cell wall surface anchor family protein n=2 Tax=Candidatus Nomuraibacteriota TaxID=1752729 RepID=A0A837HTC9_9BACT|nr:MAG: Cell wall surface anchor family protein [Candidatus Nomurabacteria bacterium GW2011_GWD2_39_12]KKR20163.1 MAG: Cell wall surface anchor family protein [Candidatus Nomurabacteria bacterium GW2011_GWC2_39_41]KKR36466.1 MAG: Cell wall surface anchor family protein [Candidatus Nomurabacteria bacterium GW2011_GWE2_40_10]KKR38216.1 MAG: Cell wall surface anchor family protein [Candidatus Nomurabacteria bacterium GW2011_GWB1_40_11]KKR39949.1 MAG: seg [Parcubacteria group bacterium GW2011_GWC1_
MSNILNLKGVKFFAIVVLAMAVLATFGMVAVQTASADCSITMTLRVGSTGDEVKCLQAIVGATADGKFGPLTKAAVMAWQSGHSLVADGVVGPLTRAALVSGGSMSTTLPAGCTSTAGYSPTTGTSCSTVVVTPPAAGCEGGNLFNSNTGASCTGAVVVASGPVSVSLASNNPASSTIVATQATADLAHFTFSGVGTVTGVVLQRIGVSADSTPSNVYLFDGATRMTDAASVSNNGKVTFSVPSGIFTVNGSKTIAIKSDIATGTSGQTLGFTLASFTTAAGTSSVNLSGNIHTIASATLAAVSAGTVTPSGATITPAANVTVWQSTLNVSQRDVWMKRIALRNVGSAPAASFQNFKLFVNGIQVATALGLDVNGYVTFDLMAAPVLLTSGSRVVRVDTDVISGASRTVQFSLRNAADVDFVDSSFNVNIAPTSAPWTPTTASTISGSSGGTLTIEKDTTSPSTNVTLAGSDINIATFRVTAYGEAIKIETLSGGFTFTDGGTANAAATLRNGRLLISSDSGTNYVQYGSTATLVAAGTSFTLNYTVVPGTPVLVQLHADIFDNDGTGTLDTSDTLLGRIIAGSSNAQRVDSLGSFSTAAASANTLTIASASITLTKNGTYANQTTSLPATNFRIGSWNLAGSSVEDVLLTTLSFDINDGVAGTEFDEGDIRNMYVVMKNASGTIVAQPAPIDTLGTGADQNFSINYTLLKNQNVTFDLYANLTDDGLDMVAGVSGGSDNVDDDDGFATVFQVSGTSLVSGQTVTGGNGTATVAGQTISEAAATITATKNSSSPVAGIVYDNQTITSLDAKFAAVTAAFDITDITLTLPAAGATVVQNVMLYEGGTLIATAPGGAETVTFSGLTWNVPATGSGYKVLSVKLQLGTIGVGGGTTGASILTTLTAFTAVNKSTGVSAAGTVTAATSSALNAFAAIPVITQVTLASNSLLNTSARPLLRFKVDATGGDIAWGFLTFKVTKDAATTVGTDATTGITLWDVTAGGNTSVVGVFTNAATVYGAGAGPADIGFVPTAEQTISGSKTYELRGNIAAADASGDFVTVTLDNDSAAIVASDQLTDIDADTDAPIIWSDISASSHATTTNDWTSDFGVKNLPVADSLNWPA